MGPKADPYAILDQVVDEFYARCVRARDDIDEIEDQTLQRGRAGVPPHLRAVRDGIEMPAGRALTGRHVRSCRTDSNMYGVDVELQRNLRDVLDHILRIADGVDSFRALLGKVR